MNDYRILVVDDEEDLCEILKFNLENEGYEVDTANSAEEALKMDISSYHLILLDVMMGEISGFKMANMLKKDKKTARVPIIFITAKDTENDTVTGFNLGAPNIREFAPGENCFLDICTFDSPEGVAAFMNQCYDDEALYERFYAWRKRPLLLSFTKKLEQVRSNPLIRLCQKIHELKLGGI